MTEYTVTLQLYEQRIAEILSLRTELDRLKAERQILKEQADYAIDELATAEVQRDAAIARAEDAESWGSRAQLKEQLDAALAQVKELQSYLRSRTSNHYSECRCDDCLALAATEPKR